MSEQLMQLIKENGIENVNKMFLEYFALMMAKSLKYDEVAEALDSNNCDLGLIHKIMEQDEYDS